MFFRTSPNICSIMSIDDVTVENLLELNEVTNLLYLDKKKITKPEELEKFTELEKV